MDPWASPSPPASFSRKRLITADLGLVAILRDHSPALRPIKESDQQQCETDRPSKRVMQMVRSGGDNDQFITLVKKLQKEKTQRRLKLRQEFEKRQKEIDEEAENERKRKESEQNAKRKSTAERLNSNRIELAKRRSDRAVAKSLSEQRLTEVRRNSYLHEKLESEFTSQQISAIRSRDDSLLRRKQSFPSAVDSKALWQHMQAVDQSFYSQEAARRAKATYKQAMFRRWQEELRVLGPSKAGVRVIAEAKRQKAEPMQRAQSVKGLYERKQRYGLLVRELFPPKVAARLPATQRSNPKPTIAYPRNRLKRRWTPQGIKRAPQPQPIPRQDYLTALRRDSESTFSSNPSVNYRPKMTEIWSDSRLSSRERMDRLRKEMRKVERVANKHESLLARMDRRWSLGAEGGQAVADLYVRAIRDKLELVHMIDMH